MASPTAIFGSERISECVWSTAVGGACTRARTTRGRENSMPGQDRREMAAVFAGGALGPAPAAPSTACSRLALADLRGQHRRRFLLGYFMTRLLERLPLSSYRRPVLGTGLCGGLTTFSTMQVETPADARRPPLRLALVLRGGQRHRRPGRGLCGQRAGAPGPASAPHDGAIWFGVVLDRRSRLGPPFHGRPRSRARSPRLSRRHAGRQPQRRNDSRDADRAGAAARPKHCWPGRPLVGSYTTFSTWMLETQRLAEETPASVGRRSTSSSASLSASPRPRSGHWIGEHL